MRKDNPFCPFCSETTTCPRHKQKGVKEVKVIKAIPKVSEKNKGKSSEEKERKKYVIPKKSDKQKAIDRELKKMYPVFLSRPENEMCQVKQQGCLGKATTVHHVRGRIGDQVFEVKDWMASCVWCNVKLESDPRAKEKGLKKSKFYE